MRNKTRFGPAVTRFVTWTVARDYTDALDARLGCAVGVWLAGKCRNSQSSIDFLSLAGMTLCHTISLVCSL